MKESSEKEKETPWPKSVRIAGYVAIAVAVPASVMQVIIEFPYVRELMLRSKSSWAEAIIKFLRSNWLNEGLFDNETRKGLVQEYELDRLMLHKVPLRGLRTGGVDEFVDHHLLPSVVASEDRIWKELHPDDHVSDMKGKVSFEFMDIVETDKSPSDYSNTFDDVLLAQQSHHDDEDENKKLFKIAQGISPWQYMAVQHEVASGIVAVKKKSTESNRDTKKIDYDKARIIELENQEAQLKMEMIDPYCTKEIDEMERELAQIRKELSNLKGWRKWFR